MRVKYWTSTTILVTVLLTLAACGQSPAPTEAPTSTPKMEPTTAPTSESKFPLAEILTDEGGPVVITGEVAYTFPFFTAGVAEPIIILEDQTGFVDRDRNYIFPTASQVLGQITSDFYTSPFTYSLTLPFVPNGTLRDVDQDGERDEGVMVFAVAYWTNTWGDPYLEKRDQGGGGWSGAYASTRVSDDRDKYLEVYGGTYLVYAPAEGQGFPSSFGEDEKLFTSDDLIVQIPQGWTLVDMDSDPFIFDQSREPKIDLYEPESLALDDFSVLSYTEAFDAMLDKMRKEYAFTDSKGIDWEELNTRFRPRFDDAENSNDTEAYYLALRDFLWSIPDGHIGMDFSGLISQFQMETGGGLGVALAELEDGRVLVNFLLEGSPADEAGIEFGAEILEINDQLISEAISQTVPWSSPFSTEHTKRLQQLRYVTRFPLGSEVVLTYKNPGGTPQTKTLKVSSERESFDFSSFSTGITGFELPVEFEVLDNGYGYVKIVDFLDNELLTIQLWERMIQNLNENNIPGLIIDMRFNGGGSGYLADQMAAYFFDEELIAGNTSHYDKNSGEFYADPGDEDTLYPPREELRYFGSLVVIISPACSSACEFFAYDLTLQDRATIVGEYPTGGLGGSIQAFIMPANTRVQFTIGRAVDANGEIHIEGKGVVPDVRIPITEESVLATQLEDQDEMLEKAIEVILRPRGAGVTPEGPPTVASQTEAEAALQSGTPILEDLAQESYDEELYEPATIVYDVPLGRSRDVLWVTGWCAAPDNFDQNWDEISIVLTLDGVVLELDQFVRLDGFSGGNQCRYYYTALTDWPIGEHILTTEMIFATSLDDGIQDTLYAPGSRIYEYHVYVGR